MSVILKLKYFLPSSVIPHHSLQSLLVNVRSTVKSFTLHHSTVTSSETKKNDQKLRIMFFGTDSFAVESLARLNQELLADTGCVGRLEVSCLPMKTLVPAVTHYAQKHNLNVHVWPPDLDHISSNFDLGVVASFGKLIPRPVIQAFPRGIINVHGSLLPRWRGAAPVIHALKNGDTKTGITIMKIKAHKFDVGEMLSAREVDVDEDITRPELTDKLAGVGAELLLEVIRDYDTFEKGAKQQDDADMTLAPLFDKSEAVIDWCNMTNIQVYNLWRAVGDLTKLRTVFQATGLDVRIATILHPRCLEGADLDPEAESGTVVFIRRSKKSKYVCVKCSEGWVAISDIYYHNKKVMKPIDFYNGLLSRPGSHRFC